MREIAFTIYGTPRPSGSRRPIAIRNGAGVVVNVRSIDSAGQKGKDWRASVQSSVPEIGELLRGPLSVAFTFFAPRPKGHYGTGKKSAVLKATAPEWPIGRPDVLKLARAVEDSLTGIVWLDDAQIVSETLLKEYGEPARCEVTIREISR